MKKIIILLIAVFFTTNIFSQVPEKLSYQAVIRNVNNNLVTNSNIGMQISILKDSPSGTAVYVERQFPSTNENGLVTLEIGNGSVVSGSFSTIDWSLNSYYIKTETDLNGGANYTISGTSQILSVPYALHAKTAESISGTITETDPVFGVSAAQGITPANINNWNAAYTWGNHSGLYAPLAHVGATGNAHEVATTTENGFMSAADKIKLNGLGSVGEMTYPAEGIALSKGSSWGTSIVDNSANWNTAYNWGNHATAGYLKSESDTMVWKKKGNNIYFNSGNIGLGTTNPSRTFDLSGSMRVVNEQSASYIENYGLGDVYNYAGLKLGDKTSSKYWGIQHTKRTGQLNDFFIEYYDGVSTWTQPFTIKPNGNVGIGTELPTTKLDVNGEINVNNNKITDVAKPINNNDAANKEYVDAKSEYRVSTTGDTLFLGKYHYVIINGISASNPHSTGIKTVSGPEILDYDKNSYKTVIIGEQTWMAENLKTTHYNDGKAIPKGQISVWNSLNEGSYCYYNNDVAIQAIYGNLYNWYVISDASNVCPVGWHVPDNDEWSTLVSNLGGTKIAGGKIKETGTLHWLFPNTDATNLSGFNYLPCGDINSGSDNIFSSLGEWGSSWTATEIDESHASHVSINYLNEYGFSVDDITSLSGNYLRYMRKTNGISIRCIKD